MDDKFLSYSTSSKSRDFSNFDGTIQNLYTSDFGGLTPVFVKPVLADDSFKISLNSEVKVNTLSAPAYSNIKQNFYSFFVANQSVWKHWNSFISNGTDFQNIYGSNITNQDLNNVWKIPSIQTNHLQQITKIAKGFSIPIFTLHFSDFKTAYLENSIDLLRVIPKNEEQSVSLNKLQITEANSSFTYVFNGFITVLGNLSNFQYVTSDSFINNLFQFYHPEWRLLLKICPYVHFNNASMIYLNGTYRLRFDSIDFGCSIDDYISLFKLLFSYPIFRNPVFSDTFNYQVSRYSQYIKFRNFCDESSSTIDINQSPFGHKSSTLDTSHFGHLLLNSTTFYRKSVNNSEFTDFIPDYDFTNLNGVKHLVTSAKYVKLSNFWSKEQIIVTISGSQGADGDYVLWRVSDSVVLASSVDDSDFYIQLFESDDYYPELAPHSLCMDFGQNEYDNLYLTPIDSSVTGVSPYIHVTTPNELNDPDSNIVKYYPSAQIQSAESCDSLIPIYVHEYEYLIQDIAGKYREFTIANSDDSPNVTLDFIPLLDSSAISNGMTTFTFMLYLCNSVCKTLDYNNIVFEGFTVRDFISYLGEHINALPFMAESKIFDEYFRNRTVSSPELNYCEVNSSALYLYNNYDCIYHYRTPKNKYIDYTDNAYQNSWAIPFDVLPKNGVGTFNLNRINADYDIPVAIQGFEEFHYFNITCFADLFALLTGFQLNHCVNHQVIKPYESLFVQENDKYLDVLYGAIIDRFYLPNYYNGLLHYKYQNFNKDYFSSALLDAMSGANVEEIPDTITELRTAEAKQSFWETTAVARSFKKFAQKMFGTTPSHMENNRPLLLGQSHNRISIGEIIQTSGTAETPQGTRTGIAGGHSVSGICKHNFNEQGYLVILSSITLDSQYYQGLHRNLTPYDGFLDYPFANFYNIGNQSINIREISYNSNPRYHSNPMISTLGNSLRYRDTISLVPSRFTTVANNPTKVTQNNYTFSYDPNYCVQSDTNFDDIFGYVPRFSEWKFNFDELHGDFRNTLMSWNTFRTLHTIPFLSHNFINWELSGFNYDLNRLFAVTDDSDKFIVSLYINVEMRRPIPYYTIPKSVN